MSATEILARVQAHPSRADLHAPLVESLGLPSEVVLHSSHPPSPWQGYRACLADLPQSGHVLVIQDDAKVARNFADALRLIAQDIPVVLFVGTNGQRMVKTLRNAVGPYVDLYWRSFVPAVAILWPVEKARELYEWTSENPTLPGNPNPRSDDAVIGHWMRRTNQRIVATVPSIVEHTDVPSVKGTANCVGVRALRFAEDALSVEW